MFSFSDKSSSSSFSVLKHLDQRLQKIRDCVLTTVSEADLGNVALHIRVLWRARSVSRSPESAKVRSVLLPTELLLC